MKNGIAHLHTSLNPAPSIYMYLTGSDVTPIRNLEAMSDPQSLIFSVQAAEKVCEITNTL